MSVNNTFFILSLLIAFVTASFNHQLAGFSKRATIGGVALNASPDSSGAKVCPEGTTIFAGGYCCPTGTYPTDWDEFLTLACCPSDVDCTAELKACPHCAEPSWVYWDDPDNFVTCCEENYYPSQQDTCVSDPNQLVVGMTTVSQCTSGATAAATKAPTPSVNATNNPTVNNSAAATSDNTPTAGGTNTFSVGTAGTNTFSVQSAGTKTFSVQPAGPTTPAVGTESSVIVVTSSLTTPGPTPNVSSSTAGATATDNGASSSLLDATHWSYSLIWPLLLALPGLLMLTL